MTWWWRGVVALNPRPWPVAVRLPVPFAELLTEVGSGRTVRPEEGVVVAELPASSGRVFALRG